MKLITTRRAVAAAFLLGSVSLAFAGGWGHGPSLSQGKKIAQQTVTDVKNGASAIGKPLEEARKQVQDPGGYKKKADEMQKGVHQEIENTKTWLDETKRWIDAVRKETTKDVYVLVGMICGTICFVAFMFRRRKPSSAPTAVGSTVRPLHC